MVGKKISVFEYFERYMQFFFCVGTYEVRPLLLNGVSVFDTLIGHRHSYDTYKIRIREVSNTKSNC